MWRVASPVGQDMGGRSSLWIDASAWRLPAAMRKAGSPMADDDKDSKTEAPSEKRISDAVEEGNVPFSREVTTFASAIALYIYFVFFLPSGFTSLAEG